MFQTPIETTSHLKVTSISLLGSRSSQQDALDYRQLGSHLLLAAVCDGMGGLNGGRAAAFEACRGFFEEWEKEAASETPDLRSIARKLDRRVAALTGRDGLPLDGGSTLTAAVFSQNHVNWVAVGDSRLGLFRGGEILWLNRLHNYRLELELGLARGDLSPQEYELELPKGAALLSYLGCGGLSYIDCSQLSLVPEDLFLLCSDGFYDLLPEVHLKELLLGLNREMDNLPQLLSPFLSAEGQSMDNASAIIIRYTEKERTSNEFSQM